MEYTKLGNAELTASRICMGCMGFGDPGRGQHSWTIDEAQSRDIIRRGLELGVNFFDTAIAYQSGTSEQYLGRALRDFAQRDKVVVATKFLPRTQEEIETGVTGQQHIERMLNKSLENLGMDYADLYIYHMIRQSKGYQPKMQIKIQNIPELKRPDCSGILLFLEPHFPRTGLLTGKSFYGFYSVAMNFVVKWWSQEQRRRADRYSNH